MRLLPSRCPGIFFFAKLTQRIYKERASSYDVYVCFFLHEFSDFGGRDYEGWRLSGCNIDQRNVTPLSSG
jgi:hypothetical protein